VGDTDEHGYENYALIFEISGASRLDRRSLGTYCKTQRKFNSGLDHFLRATDIRIDKGLDAVCAKIEELLAIVVLLLFAQPVFGLRDLEFSTSVQSHETHTEVGSAWLFVRSLIKVTETERAYRGRVPDIRRSLAHSATRIRKWGSWAVRQNPAGVKRSAPDNEA
jgi:hypothetical protein